MEVTHEFAFFVFNLLLYSISSFIVAIDAALSVYSAVDFGASCGVLPPRCDLIRLELWLALVFPAAIATRCGNLFRISV